MSKFKVNRLTILIIILVVLVLFVTGREVVSWITSSQEAAERNEARRIVIEEAMAQDGYYSDYATSEETLNDVYMTRKVKLLDTAGNPAVGLSFVENVYTTEDGRVRPMGYSAPYIETGLTVRDNQVFRMITDESTGDLTEDPLFRYWIIPAGQTVHTFISNTVEKEIGLSNGERFCQFEKQDPENYMYYPDNYEVYLAIDNKQLAASTLPTDTIIGTYGSTVCGGGFSGGEVWKIGNVLIQTIGGYATDFGVSAL